MATTSNAAPAWGRSMLVSSSCMTASQFECDVKAGRRAQLWVGEVTGERLDADFPEALKNGQALCYLVNTICPGTISKIEESTSPFREMANISAFIGGCRQIGVPHHALFETLDLYNEKRLSQVVGCLFALSEKAKQSMPAFKGPYLCSINQPEVAPLGEGCKGNASSTLRGTRMPPASGTPGKVDLCKPSYQRSLNFDTLADDAEGDKPQSLSPAAQRCGPLTCDVDVEEASRGTTTALPQESGMPEGAAPYESATEEDLGTVGGRSSSDGHERRSFTREEGYRLRREALDRADAELEAALWIEGVTGVTFPGKFSSSLRDGVLLCKVMNAIQPGIITKIHKGGVGSRELENIGAFLISCRAVGVPEHLLFDMEDLHEKRNLQAVVQCLHALDIAVQSTIPSFRGPFLGTKSDAFSTVNAKGLRKQLGKGPGARGGIDVAALEKKPGVNKQAGVLDGKQPNVKDDATATITPAESPCGDAVPRHLTDAKVKQIPAPPPVPPATSRNKVKSGDPNARMGLLARASSPLQAVSPFRRKIKRSMSTPRQDVLPDTACAEKVAIGERKSLSRDARARRLERFMSADNDNDDVQRCSNDLLVKVQLHSKDVVSQVQAFVEFQTRIPWRVKGDMYESLRDGWQLVLLANSIRPGSIRRVHNSIMPAKHMQNIGNFLTFCRRIGVSRALIFELPDLYAKRNLANVAKTLFSLRSLASNVGFARAMHRTYSSIETSLLSSAVAKAAVSVTSDYADVPVGQG